MNKLNLKPERKRRPSFFVTTCFLSTLLILLHDPGGIKSVYSQVNYPVVKGWMKYTDLPNALYQHLSAQAFEYLARRSEIIRRLQTKADWLERQRVIRETFGKIVGPFPEKTPLKAQIWGVVEKATYRIEKVVFESQPGYHVTAALFLPKQCTKKTPAVLFCSGHSEIAFRSETYQTMVLNLVQKGFIVLAFDPVGQGERLQYFDSLTGGTRTGPTTLEHSYSGAQCFISGSSQARYMIWDGIRCVDYLCTRKEVDPKRIGITGRSGGGTQSAYIAAFDDRILAVAPEGYLTSFQRLFESCGPQDAEQNFYHGIASGLDFADLLAVRAPKPALMITTTRDFFSIQGARETEAEVMRIYQAFGALKNFSKVEDDFEHGSTLKNREAMYAFFQRHLNLPGDPTDQPVEFLTPEELTIVPTGQVITAFEENTTFDLNKKATEKLLQKMKFSRNNDIRQHLKQVKQAAKKLSGFVSPTAAGDVVFTGRYPKDDYDIEQYFIDGEGDYIIPFSLLLPKQSQNSPVVIYLHPQGKFANSRSVQEMEWLAQNKIAVLAPDLIGTGEAGGGRFHGDAYKFRLGEGDFNIWFAAIQVGRSIVGIQAGDVIRLVDYLKHRPDIHPERICVLGKREMGSTVLHAAAFCQDIAQVALIEPYISFRSIVMNEYYKPHFIPTTVAGALTAYDLPDLAACVASRKLLLVNVTDQNGKAIRSDLLDSEVAVVKKAYANLGKPDHFRIKNQNFKIRFEDIFSEWLLK